MSDRECDRSSTSSRVEVGGRTDDNLEDVDMVGLGDCDIFDADTGNIFLSRLE